MFVIDPGSVCRLECYTLMMSTQLCVDGSWASDFEPKGISAVSAFLNLFFIINRPGKAASSCIFTLLCKLWKGSEAWKKMPCSPIYRSWSVCCRMQLFGSYLFFCLGFGLLAEKTTCPTFLLEQTGSTLVNIIALQKKGVLL